MQKQAETLKEFRNLDSERLAYEGTLTLQELRNSERLLTKAENSRQSASSEEQEASKALTDAEQRRKALMASMAAEEENCAASMRKPWPYTTNWTA